MGKGAAIGLDIGGGSTKVGLVDGSGGLLDSSRVVLPEDAGFEDILGLYRRAMDKFPNGATLPVGIAYPGHIDRRRRVGLNSNVPALDGHPLAAALGRRGRPAPLLNDADAAALGEARHHTEGQAGRMLMVTIGTGIGVAMVVAGRVLETAGGTLGDSGHVNVDPAGRHKCRQGCRGCLESVASGDAVARDATELAAAGGSPRLAEELAAAGTVSTAAACRAALAGDPAVLALFARMADWLGMAVASWRATFHPDLVVLGGGLSVLGMPFLEQIRAEADDRSLPFLTTHCRLALAETGNDAGMIGAAMAALQAENEVPPHV